MHIQDGLHLVYVSESKQIKVVKQMVQVVNRKALTKSSLQRSDFLVSIKERLRESSKQAGHSQFGLCPAKMSSRVDYGWFASGIRNGITAP